VRLFRVIGFRAKGLVISLAFMVPLVFVAWPYFAEKSSAIEFSAKERLGVACLRAALPLLPALHRQRLAATLEAAQGKPPADLAKARSAIDAALKMLAEAESQLGPQLDTGKVHAALLVKL